MIFVAYLAASYRGNAGNVVAAVAVLSSGEVSAQHGHKPGAVLQWQSCIMLPCTAS